MKFFKSNTIRFVYQIITATTIICCAAACSTSYKAKPMPIKAPSAYANATDIAGATVGAQAFVDTKAAQEAFGFNVREAGLLPVQVVFDNQGGKPLQINPGQTFLEDNEGNLWPILSSEIAYERATKYSKTKKIFKESAYGAFLGSAAGAVVGAAVGIVTGENVAAAAGKGAAAGAAAGATIGGVKGYASADDARREVIDDLHSKGLEQKAITPGGLSYGFLFFPGEAQSARQLRLQIVEKDTSAIHTGILPF